MANQTGPLPWPPKFALYHYGRSGFTPIRSSFPPLPNVPGISAATRIQNEREDAFQREFLKDFTVQELVDLDGFTSATLKRSTLRTDRPIHRLFASARWEVTPSPDHQRQDLYPLPNRPGMSGNWVYGNVLVRNAITPSLRIATQIMSSIYMLPWFTALLSYGGMATIPTSRIHQDDLTTTPLLAGNLKTFSAPLFMTSAMLMDARTRFDRIINELTTSCNYQLGFCKARVDPWDDSNCNKYWGITHEDNFQNIFTFLLYEEVEPLLRPDLTDAERMGAEWNIANTIVHEVCHAFWMVQKNRSPVINEAYFEDEPVAELGFAMERAVFGGVADPMIEGTDITSIGYWLGIENTALDLAFRSTDPLLASPSLLLTQTCFPIKAEFFEDMQQEDFWMPNIALYGMSALHARNLKIGVESTFKSNGLLPGNRLGMAFEPDYDRIQATDFRLHQFKVKLLEYIKQCGAQMNGIERMNIRIGQAILFNSVYEELFWEKTVETRNFLDSVVTTLQYVAREIKHIAAIDAFQGLSSNLQRQDRLDDLLRWNRGARIYAKGCFDLIAGDPDYIGTATIYQRRGALELCRMLLFAPHGTTTTVQGYGEQGLVVKTNRQIRLNQPALCQRTLGELFDAEDGSLFMESLRLIFASEREYMILIDSGRTLASDATTLTDTFNRTTRAVEIPVPLRNYCDGRLDSKNIQKWIVELDGWILRAKNYLDVCRAVAATL
ncbi:hypothetical protein BKA65DRAFT_593035 [Rhexocercosporidium sp. MPI-PUGE-AT-0058]|nr:hypothetical protein BKA65DRAFT_593035 [Rhexocercosporidium sp. MPI-PUGE-AT-0058]